MILKLTQLQVDILLALSDNKGYSNSQLAEMLKKEKSNLSKPLGELEDEGLIFKESRKNTEDKRHSDFPYYLDKSRSIEIFRLVMEKSLKTDKKLQDILSNSNFINYVIINSNLIKFLNSFEGLSNDPQTISSISKMIFKNEIIIEEYKKQMDEVITYPEDLSILKTLTDRRFVEILQNFDPYESLIFYKKVINKTYSDLYGKIAAKSGAKDSDLLRKFLEYDISLSPFTSFPINDPILLLFMRPFERIYDDVYLIEKSDQDMMVQRAYFIYSNFAEILLSGILSIREEEEGFEAIYTGGVDTKEEYEQVKKIHFIRFLRKDLFFKKEYLNSLIKELIFYWNIASLRLDWLYYKLSEIAQISPGTKKRYYIYVDSDGIQAINLDTHTKAFHPEITREAMMITALWSGETDPFTTLRYCSCFSDFGLEEKQIKIEEIISNVEESLNYQ